MIKKIHSFFLITLLLFFIAISAHAQNATIDSLNKIGETAEKLKNTENMPVIEDISTIAKAVRGATETYKSIKTKVSSTIDYCRNVINSAKEIRKKIESTGSRIKKFIQDKTGLISKNCEFNIFLA